MRPPLDNEEVQAAKGYAVYHETLPNKKMAKDPVDEWYCAIVNEEFKLLILARSGALCTLVA